MEWRLLLSVPERKILSFLERQVPMLFSRALPATLLGLGALWLGAGCAEEADEMRGPELADPGIALLGGPTGSTGTNNFPPPDFHSLKGTIYTSTSMALGDYDGSAEQWNLASNTANDTLVAGDSGRTALKYMARCGVSETVTLHAVLGSTPYTFPGQGILSTTAGWLGAGLSNSQAQDLFACLLGHLNARGVEVPINLSGPSVTNTEGADSNFTWEEALWVAEITSPGTHKRSFSFQVWPLDDLMSCSEYVEQLEDRVCGTYSGTCGLTIRTDRSTACSEGAAGWTCTGLSGVALPAIKTRLKSTDVELLYDSCP